MRKKTAEQKIRALFLAGEEDNRVIAEKAKCSRAYVYQVRHRMKNEQYSKTQAKLIAMTQQDPRYAPKILFTPDPQITMIEPEEESSFWLKNAREIISVVIVVAALVFVFVKFGVSHA
jgi:lipopolysaccharide biosynthesis regulator YciM